MKIVYILPYDWGGMPHYTAELANAVSKYAAVTVIGTQSINEDYFLKRIKIIKVLEGPKFSSDHPERSLSAENILSFLSFKRLSIIDELDPDIIHLTTPLIPQLSIFLSLYKFDKKYPIFYTKHGIFTGSGLKMKLVEEYLLGSCERFFRFEKIIVHTSNDKQLLANIRSIPDDKILIIPHGAYSLFKSFKERDYPREKNSILFFGHIREYKGLEYLVKAYPLIRKEIPDLKLIIAGKGDLSPYLRSHDGFKASEIEIYNEFISDEKVSELFQRADLVVLPYTMMSGQSGILNIACAFNAPIVATDVGGFREIVKDGMTGYLVPPRDSRALAESVLRILKNDELKESMRLNLSMKSRELSWDNVALSYIAAYKEAVDRFNRGNHNHSAANDG